MTGQPYMMREIDRWCDRIRRYGNFTSPYESGQYARAWRKQVELPSAAFAWGQVSNVAWFVENGTRNDDGSVRMEAALCP
ncbi:hypothetical protein [Asanoa siamensis]|uniref:hypothetical protein n=1 Tax=Asanoa siamensis TaxID=926357 RepID=UPI00194495CD|nr:hypothetical protein [Asanoa siamensis]